MARLLLVSAVGIFVVAGFLYGDDKPSSTAEKPVTKLPVYFDKLDLTGSQRKRISKVREDYAMRIKDLEEQIRELRRKERGEMEGILTDGQKEKLRELRREKAPSLPKSQDKDK